MFLESSGHALACPAMRGAQNCKLQIAMRPIDVSGGGGGPLTSKDESVSAWVDGNHTPAGLFFCTLG